MHGQRNINSGMSGEDTGQERGAIKNARSHRLTNRSTFLFIDYLR